MSIDEKVRKKMELIADAVDAWRNGELSTFSAYYVIMVEPEEPSEKVKKVVLESILKRHRDYCPKSPDHKHSFFDYTYWGSEYPECQYCGFLDVTRELPAYGEVKDDG